MSAAVSGNAPQMEIRIGQCRMPLGRILPRRFLAVIVLAGTAVAALGAPSALAAKSLVGKKAPNFVRTDLNGARLDLKNYRGKVVLLNFWATWCAPCQIEMPIFAAWQRQYGPQGLQVIGISMDDSPTPVRHLLQKLQLNYPIAMGDAPLGESYGSVLGLPLTYLIDSNGVVRAQFQGETDPKTIEKQLKLLLPHR